MKHICFDARLINAAGIGRYLKTLIKGISETEYKLSLLVKKEKILPNSIPLNADLFSFKEQWEIPCKIPSCDLFFSPHFNIPLFPIRAKKRIVTLCDAYHLDHLQSFPLTQKIYATFFYRASVIYADHVITISNFSKQRLLEKCCVNATKISVIYPGIEIEKFEPSYLPEKKPYLLFVGNIKPHKNLKRLLYAFRDFLNKQKDPIQLVLCGKKEGFIHASPDLENLIQNDPHLKKNVSVIGEVSEKNLISLYQGCELFIFPSLYEGFGYPPLEAMAAGKAVIAANAGSIPEICGNACLYFDPYSVLQIRQQIERVLKDHTLKKKLIDEGKKHVQQYHEKKTIHAHLKLIENLV